MLERVVRVVATAVIWLLCGVAIPGLLSFAVGLAPMRWLTWGPGLDGWLVIYFAAGSGLASGALVIAWAYSVYPSLEQRMSTLWALVASVVGLCSGSILGARWWQPAHFADLAWLVVGISALVGLTGAQALMHTRWRHVVAEQFKEL